MCFYFNKLDFVSGTLSISYKPTLSYDQPIQDVLAVLNNHIDKERLMRASLLGPHREDFEFLIDGQLCKNFYSRGVSRVVSYLFYLSKAFIVSEKTKLPMLVLMDEPFSELHGHVKQQLFHYIPKSFYIVYTSTQMDEISSLNPNSLYRLEHGELCRH